MLRCGVFLKTYGLASEGLPNDCPVAQREHSLCSPWQNLPLRNIRDIQNTNSVEFAIAISFHLLIELFFENLCHVSGEEAGRHCHLARKISQEKHLVVGDEA